MALVSLNDVCKDFAGTKILENISFSIENKDRIGLIGLNGAGKSSIIKIILGEENVSSGTLFVDKNIRIAYVSQNPTFSYDNNTVLEELKSVFSYEYEIFEKIQKLNVLISLDPSKKDELDKLTNIFISRDGYNIETKIRQIINGLELENLTDSLIQKLSGGERTRLCIAKLLLQEPELLILDEPTNHLDIASIEWLEDFLKKYNKAFLLVSHDRIFLDNVCNKIFEIENRKLYKYKGNFSDFVIQKEMFIKGEIKAFDKEQEIIKKMEEYIRRNKAGRMAKQAKGREKLLNRIVRKDNPVFSNRKMKLKFEFTQDSAQNVLEVKHLEKSFDNKKILNDINFKVYKGDRIGIIGKNGSGKSTLLKIIANKISDYSGEIELGTRVKLSYYDQNHENLHEENTILNELNTSVNYKEEDLRSLAGAFLFTSEDVDKLIKNLSGGEKVRVSFIKMLQEQANFLLLDEPTNHLDIYSIEVLEEALCDFEGSLLIVSHNRHFLDTVCNTIYVLDDKGLTSFKGNYNEYKESLKNKNVTLKDESKKIAYLEQKERNKKVNKLKKDIEKTETRIDEISNKKEELNKEMFLSDVATNISKLTVIQEEIEKLEEEELNLLELWENLNEELGELDV